MPVASDAGFPSHRVADESSASVGSSALSDVDPGRWRSGGSSAGHAFEPTQCRDCDLTGVGFLDAAGLTTLLVARRRSLAWWSQDYPGLRGAPEPETPNEWRRRRVERLRHLLSGDKSKTTGDGRL